MPDSRSLDLIFDQTDTDEHDHPIVRLQFRYGQKLARIELPVGAPLSEKASGYDVYRRDAVEFLEALSAWVASSKSIS